MILGFIKENKGLFNTILSAVIIETLVILFFIIGVI